MNRGPGAQRGRPDSGDEEELPHKVRRSRQGERDVAGEVKLLNIVEDIGAFCTCIWTMGYFMSEFQSFEKVYPSLPVHCLCAMVFTTKA